MDNGEMFGTWCRFVVVGLLMVGASAVIVGRRASSDDCRHGCPENEIDGRGCCRAPKVDTTGDAAANKAADEKQAADEKMAEARRADKKAADAKPAAAAKKAADVRSMTATTAVPAATSGCPSDMVHVPGRTFSMGSPSGMGEEDEHPQHQVTLAGYCIDRTEVTVAAYTRCVASGKCTAAQEPAKTGFDSLCNGTRVDRQDHPVNCVDWNQATAYCVWVKKRLPSEAEWEYAARGGDGRTYPWGNEAPSAKRLNACGRECRALCKSLGLGDWKVMYEDSDARAGTAPVGSFQSGASRLGALDMAGNVWEWTADWYGAYAAAARTNPHGPKEGRARVIRGGGWNSEDVAKVRGASRNRIDPALRNTDLGLRCVRGD
jgi:formylglycine-generating enzyme required for sulfatase activity